MAVSLLGISLAHGQQTLDISQVADGGAFQTTFVISNALPIVGTASLTCFQDSSNNATIPWSIPLIENVNLASISMPPAGTVFLHTPGTATNLTQGWCQIQAGAGIAAYAIFTQQVAGRPNQSGTAVAAAPTTRVLVPFDNTNGQVTSIGLANDSATQATIEVGTQATTGGITQGTSIVLPAQGQIAFALPTQVPSSNGVQGMMELFSSTGNISVLALLFNSSGSFTAAPVYQSSGAPVIVPGSGSSSTRFVSFSANSLQFQPSGSAAGTVSAVFTPNAAGGTFSVNVGGGMTFTDGTFASNGASFTAMTLQANTTTPPFGTFTAPGAGTFTVASASLTFALTPTFSFPNGATTIQQGNLTGTLTVTGTAAGSTTSTTFTGPISASYQGTVSQ